MPRHLYLKPQLTSDELKQRYRDSQDAIESRRYHLLWLVSKGHTLKQASMITTLSYRYARSVVQSYNRQGPEGVRNRHKERRPARVAALLSDEQQQALKEALKQAPADKGKWTSRKVAQWMSEKLGRKVAVQRGWDYLKRLDMVRRKPRPRHLKASYEEQEHFKKS